MAATAKKLAPAGTVTLSADELKSAREQLIRNLRMSAPSNPQAALLLAYFDTQWEVSAHH
jgi:hypothetical protein